jgi:iron complex transport system ATP-binding protein
MAELALDARGVCAAAGKSRVLHDVTFHADYGAVLAILGPNGAGKSTLLRALAGLSPYEGSIALDGGELSALTRREIGRRIAFVPQRTQLTSRLPVWTVVSHGRYAHRGGLAQLSARDERAIESAMQRADVTHLATREFPQLSAGEQRRVLLARALATEARVLLLDEPTASLDIPHALSLFETLRVLAESGHCVVIVLHQLDDALRFTDRALLLQSGRALAFDRSAEVITPAHVRSAYGVELIEHGGLAFRLGRSGA